MGHINLKNVSKVFGETVVIPGIDLEINEGEFVVFVGPSGCGKSTLLRLIAGLEDISGGSIDIAGQDMTQCRPGQTWTIDGVSILCAVSAYVGA